MSTHGSFPGFDKSLPIEPLAVSVTQACQITAIGKTKMWELIRSGEVETMKNGRRTLPILASLKKLVASKTRP